MSVFRGQSSAVLSVLGLAALVGSTVAAPSTTAAAVPVTAAAVPGPQSSGDSLFPDVGNRGYDVQHYGIKLGYAKSGSIRATTTITARARQPLSSLSFDLEGLSVDGVTVGSHSAAYKHVGHKLVVTPSKPVRGRFTVAVRYSGVPQTHTDPDGSPDGWIATTDGATVLSEPVGAMTWFPNNNTPRDKATFDIAVTVPRDLEVAGSGDLAGRQRRGTQTTWTWKQPQPMATYLAMISIGNYDVYHSTMITTTGRRIPVWSFIEPDLGAAASRRALVPKIIRFHERNFGRYPFNSTGIVLKNLGVGYSLETQNRPVFDADPENLPDTASIVHELAHQWYGDSVTPRDWGDVWLNEGFAQYSEWWYAARHGGRTTAGAFADLYASNPPTSNLWSPAPGDLTDPADLFSDGVYTRGGMTLEALRQKVGTADFTVIMKRWAKVKRGQTASTAEFVELAEDVSGRHLGKFFSHWLEVAERPALP
jgi:aminopeptidase N